jgi:DNA-binding transcriptional LysR family regulator
MHQIRYFLAVCDALNFTRAAERCNVSQPSLTRAIKLMELEFGGLLFLRQRANTRMTELGRILRPHLEEVQRQSCAARISAKDFLQVQRTQLCLGVMCTIAPTNLVALLTRMRGRHPALEVQVLDFDAEELEEKLIDGEMDAAICCLPGAAPDARLNLIPLFREQMQIVLPRGHRLAANRSVKIADLAGEKYVMRTKCAFNDLVDRCFDAERIACETIYQSDRDDWVFAMIASGVGFGFAPQFSIDNPGVVARPLVDPEYWREINLVTVRGRPHAPTVCALIREAAHTHWSGRGTASLLEESAASAGA